MSIDDTVYSCLQKMVSKDFVSSRQEKLYIYSRDLGACKVGKVDYLVVPGTPKEIQDVVKLAGRKKTP